MKNENTLRTLTAAVLLLGLWLLPGLTGCSSTSYQAKEEPAKNPTETVQPEKKVKEESEPLHNTLKWSTASEVENFGFDIYRSTSKDGPFTRVTSEPIPGAGTIDEPQSYVWKDFSIEPGTDYYYYIESISFAGVRERFSPVIKAPAKSAP